ncbi:aspartate ammonia-lyase [Companilactobacillus mishanensis]|uniref:Aspartate ammonia-lyase n=1 Tax=Companilactobacillus mishanensis TaxID=2486008 RepID=A0A5P0ZIY0_9LACO|nr:aspartate ammonia-lyase [Companilactobacillus mishanensis]MQS52975.1 aspartate ammonia-lyase [Companilactobacillus mishanensis]
MDERIEKDSFGELKIDEDKYFGINSKRAQDNFKINVKKTDMELIKQLAEIKLAAATANEKVGRISRRTAMVIRKSAEEIIDGKFDDQFIIPEIQGGAGTSTNMNVNEVIANRGLILLGHKRGEYKYLSPQDDVNAGQSTNDVYPSAGKLAALVKTQKLYSSLSVLIQKLEKKSEEFADIEKIGRTQLQEAVPTTLGNSFGAFAHGLQRTQKQLQKSMKSLLELNLGGTAIGTGVNTSDGYQDILYSELRKAYQVNVHPAEDLIDATQNLDSYVQVSGSLKAVAVSLSKMCHDLRLLSSGPKSGFHEITLPARQAGSSIMPGKVNPVIPEVVSQIAFEVIGNDTTITFAAESGELELNAFEPIIFHDLFESIDFLSEACMMLSTKCIDGIQANREKCEQDVNNSVETITKLTPIIGYEVASEIVHESLKTGQNVYDLLREKGIYDEDKVADLSQTDLAN